MTVIRLDHVSRTFQRPNGPTVYAVDDVSLEVGVNETLALIGESGSGKSTVGRLALGLLKPTLGSVEFDGQRLDALSGSQLRGLRARMQIVFQEPLESLNPRMKVGETIEEPLIVHSRDLSRTQRRRRVIATLEDVGLEGSFYDRYPKSLSGGQQQRVGIARAIITRPDFIVLDEPTSSLDLSVRAQILNLLGDLQAKLKLSYLFVSHDIATVRYFSHRLAVMYRGRVVERGQTQEILRLPQHAYTRALLSAALSVDPDERPPHLPLAGEPSRPTQLTQSCVLYGRCPLQSPECSTRRVELRSVGPNHEVACIKVPGEKERSTRVSDEAAAAEPVA